MSDPQPWSVTAINLPDHADNPIHTDVGARAAGFDSALVAGTTVYAYMTHPVVAAWGTQWVRNGGAELRLRRPVFDGDRVTCTVGSANASASGPSSPVAECVVEAEVAGDSRASLELFKTVSAPSQAPGDRLSPLEVIMSEHHLTYGMRAGDTLSAYVDRGIAPPVTWVNLANAVFVEHLVTGPWIHVRSRIYHQNVASLGATVRVEPTLIRRFESRAGERALVDMRFFADDMAVAVVEHEAIITLPET